MASCVMRYGLIRTKLEGHPGCCWFNSNGLPGGHCTCTCVAPRQGGPGAQGPAIRDRNRNRNSE
jgi:hypothetical protein